MMLLSQNSPLKRKWYTLALVLLLIPTYFIHTKTYPDWGDDFAQYIYQGQQIHSPSEKYKQVLNVVEYSSPKRSVAFSLILSIIPPSAEIEQYVDLISLCYILAGIVFFIFLSVHFSLPVSLAATLCVFYNFLFLRLKSEVVPEFLFIGLFYGILYLGEKKNRWVKFVVPFLLGCLFSVRFIGLSLFLSYLICLWIKEDQSLKQKIKSLLLCTLIFSVIIIFINSFFLSSIQNREVNLYGNLVFNGYNFNVLYENISIYTRYITLFFERGVPFWMNVIIRLFLFLFFVTGFILSFKKNKQVHHFAFIIYFFFLFLYPYNADTIKYLIPIIPLFIFYMIVGIEKLMDLIFQKKREFVILTFLLVLLIGNSKNIWVALHNHDPNIGPYELSVLEDFEKVKKIVKNTESIAFGKPFLINLLADRDSYFLSRENHERILKKADYFLSTKKKINELYPKIEGIKVAKGDTLELENFYLIRLIK